MSEASHEPRALAEEYLNALDQTVDEERQRELEKKLEELRERRERYAEQHGADSGIVQRVDRKIEEVEDDLEELTGAVEHVDEIRTRLLEVARDGFELSEDWLDSQVLSALTHALYDDRDSWLCLNQTRIESINDLSEINDLSRLDMEHTLLLLVGDQLGETDVVTERWARLTESNYHAPFLAVARKGEASPDDIVDELEDATRKDVKNWLEGPLYKWDELIPYYRVGEGKFTLSTTGKYFAQNYATLGNDETESSEDPSQESGDNDQQTSFDDVTQTEGDSDE